MLRPKVFKLFQKCQFDKIYTLNARKLEKTDNKHTNLKNNIINGFAIIHYAIFFNNENIAFYIINQHKNAIKRTIRSKFHYLGYIFFKGADLLTIATLSENIQLVDYILQRYRLKQMKVSFDRNNQSCLHSSAWFHTMGARVVSSDNFLVKTLIFVQNLDLDNPLHLAIKSENHQFLLQIYQQLIDNNNIIKSLRIAMIQRDSSGQTPWMLAQELNNKEVQRVVYQIKRITEFIIEQVGTQLNTDDQRIFYDKTEDSNSMILEGDIYHIEQ
ncbi:hypothetical protein SS50377_27370 [Spironucleus salmonicida]|uniref:Ankyrin repeat-containing protein n=1 Tax=Spironucleus salmonicida TaxID=348837 RepID=V6LGA8_9EUKA|nr:hypothetical protein SS50377_27370 [Spironucleus salmonicida]|eukprot:EST43328.1 Hypothetical protein SS50377_17005 [Spironucleus salmonicida]